MSKKMKKGFRITRVLLIIIGIIGLAGIALLQLDNRSLSIVVVSEENDTEEFFFSKDVIAEGRCADFVFEDTSEVKIKKLRYYGSLKSVMLQEVNFGTVATYIDTVDQGEMYWVEDGIMITGEDEVHITMNEAYVEMVQALSATLLQERLILAGYWTGLIGLALILCSVIQEICTRDKRNNHGPIFETKKFFEDTRKYWQYIVYSARADLKAEVADSYLNRLWWLLEPFFNMLVYVIVFGGVMGNSIENYATFVFSALLMWNFFNKIIGYSVKLVRTNKDVLAKVYIPKFVILFSNMILNLFKLLFSMMVLVVMMFIFKVHIGFNLFWVLPAYAVMILLAFGAGMIFLHFGVYVDDLSYAVGILLNMLMFLSGIFYDVMATLPAPLNGIMMCINPMAMLVDTMRHALLHNAAMNLPIMGMWCLLSVVLCYVGIHIVYKNENSYVKVV